MRSLFIVGTRGIPGRYGGLETFAEEVSVRLVARGFQVYVTCERLRGEPTGPAEYRGVRLLHVYVPRNRLRTFVGDREALEACRRHAAPGDVIYLQGYGGGPWLWGQIKRLRRDGIRFWLNPDGLEWKRPRWPWLVRRYLRFAEGSLLKRADCVICDAVAIRKHHAEVHRTPLERMVVIEYGAPIVTEIVDAAVIRQRDTFLERLGVAWGTYYSYVGRFVPDNNLELLIRGVLQAPVSRALLVFAPHDDEDPFYKRMSRLVTRSRHGDRVQFVGGIYDRSLLQALRLASFAYFHGHEVGGTNPALVEAMGLGCLTIALDTPFNREVLRDCALFFRKDLGSLVETLERAEALTESEVNGLREGVRYRVQSHYNWDRITDTYARLLRAA